MSSGGNAKHYEPRIHPRKVAADANRIAEQLRRDRAKPVLEAPVKLGAHK